MYRLPGLAPRSYIVKTLPTEKVARNLLKFTKPIVLEEKEKTRRCFYGELACDEEGIWNLRGNIIHERKGKDGWHGTHSTEKS